MKKMYNDLQGNPVQLDVDNPQPGVYVGVDFWTYLEINAVSRSDLQDFRKAPEKYKNKKDSKTPALDIWHAVS